LSETLNIAALWRLPLIFCCENNGYSEFSPSATVNAGEISERAKPFGVPVIVTEGNDIFAVWQAAEEAIARARDNGGPTFIEARTYRFHGHVEGEKSFLKEMYRSDDEVAARRENDPLVLFRARMLAGKAATDADLGKIETEIGERVENAAAAAARQPWPEPQSLDRFLLRATDAA
jgi:pyruvate dehydrogenase E1 component alpha subunit